MRKVGHLLNDDNPFRARYERYINSEEWQAKREQRMALDNHTCQICGLQRSPLQVHHLSYAHFGNEPMGDLITVCKTCHEIITDIENGLSELRWYYTWKAATHLADQYKAALSSEITQLIMDSIIHHVDEFPELRQLSIPQTGIYIENLLAGIRDGRKARIAPLTHDPTHIAHELKDGTFKGSETMESNAKYYASVRRYLDKRLPSLSSAYIGAVCPAGCDE